MADKKKSASTVYPFFVDGEQPSANKFNSISLQTRRNLFDLEKSIGDIWGESEPYNSSSSMKLGGLIGDKSSYSIRNGSPDEGYSLNIANIGRIIGPASKLNPYMLSEGLLGAGNSRGLEREITEFIPDEVNSFSLRYPGIAGGTVSFAGTNTPTNLVADTTQLSAIGDYYYDDSKGVVYFYGDSGISQSWEISYLTKPSNYSGGASYTGSSWNVMPDEAALEAGVRLTVSAGGDYYDFSLPAITVQNITNYSGNDGSYLNESDVNYGVQLKLPNILREMFNGGSSSIYFDDTAVGIQNSLIPEGFLYIKNVTTGEVYSSGEYYYIDNEIIRMKGVELDNLNDVYCIITVGTDITSSIQDIRLKQAEHSHSREFGEPLVKVQDIGGVVEKAGASGQFTKSENESNFAPQYLHRDGYRSNVDTGLNDSNAMRGDLMLGLSSGSPGGYVGTGSSYRLYFGSTDSSIRRSSSTLAILNRGDISSTGHDLTLRGNNSQSATAVDSSLSADRFTDYSFISKPNEYRSSATQRPGKFEFIGGPVFLNGLDWYTQTTNGAVITSGGGKIRQAKSRSEAVVDARSNFSSPVLDADWFCPGIGIASIYFNDALFTIYDVSQYRAFFNDNSALGLDWNAPLYLDIPLPKIGSGYEDQYGDTSQSGSDIRITTNQILNITGMIKLSNSDRYIALGSIGTHLNNLVQPGWILKYSSDPDDSSNREYIRVIVPSTTNCFINSDGNLTTGTGPFDLRLIITYLTHRE